ncbi:polyketide synthase [Chromobacterium violaceum]|nr:polyketide synthase [Chromobacterium violaceum]
MDSQIRVLHRKIQAQEISVEEAARELERIRAGKRFGQEARAIQPPPAIASPAPVAAYRYDEPYLRDHQFNRRRILLGLTHASLALEHGRAQLAEGEALQLKNLTFAEPVVLDEGQMLEVALRASAAGGSAFETVCRHHASQPWRHAASGELHAVSARAERDDLRQLMAGMETVEPLDAIYRISEQIHIGDSYRTLREVRRHPDGGEAVARFELGRTEAEDSRYSLHPLSLNSAFLALIPLLDSERLADNFIPFGLRSLTLHCWPAPTSGWLHVRLEKNSGELVLFDAELYDDDGQQVAALKGGMLKRLRRKNLASDDLGIEDCLFSLLREVGAERISRKQRQRNLMDLGLESGQLVELAQRIAEAAKIELEPTLFFEYPSIAELAEFLQREHGAAFAALAARPSEPPAIGIPPSTIPDAEATRDRPAAGEERDIAIIGMQGRFGEADDLDQFWSHVWQGRQLIREVPADHWEVGLWFDPDPGAHDRTYSKWGSFLSDVDKFDADFFNMSRREAQWMDPQVRLLLQGAYAAAEHAGAIPRLRGSDTGVFIGSCFNEYLDKISELGLAMDPYIATGSGTIAANRISFWFDLKGPSLMFNTACSSSLVALHAACVALRNGECGMALVGGSNLLLSSWHYRYFSAIRALSPTGRCHTFDERADGYVPGECVAMLLLKPLSQALADGDPIHGVIKGSAALHGGYTPSLTAPSVAGEESVIVQAWQNAGIDPRSLGYIEAHGTGTKLGDPIEINALKRAFSRYTDDVGFCRIGSVKANIGHAEGAAGIAGVLKALLQIRHRKLPALAGFQRRNPHIRLEDSPLRIETEGMDWPEQAEPRRAGVSSFGFSGTNAHAVLEEYREARIFAVHRGETVLLPLSARNPERLREQAARLLEHLERREPDLAAVAYTLQIGREAMAARAVFLADSLASLRRQLRGFVDGEGLADFGPARASAEAALAAGDLEQLAALWLAGSDDGREIDWYRLYGAGAKPEKIELPAYPFARQRYWLEAPETGVKPAAATTVACYAERWVEAGEPETGSAPDRVICLLADPTLRTMLAAALEESNPQAELIFISADKRNDQDADGHYRVDTSAPGRMEEGLRQVLSAIGGGRVLYLWSMDDPRWLSDGGAIAALLKAVAGAAAVDRLLLAGRAQDALARSHLESWIGVERSLAALLPHCPVEVAMDLPQTGADDGRWLRRLLRQLGGPACGSRAYRDATALRPRLAPVELSPLPSPFVLERLDAVLITGGLGGLGLLLAGELSERARRRDAGALTLILNGRSPLSAGKQARLNQLRHDKCRVLHMRADCADDEQLAAALAEVLPQSGPIDGWIHAAGVQAGGSVLDSAPEAFEAVLRAKIASIQVLDRALAEQPLKLICHFSSSSAQLGDMGACSYAMANRFMQAYANHAQAGRASRVATINWPLWREGGMAAGDEGATELYLRTSGLRMLESAEGLSLLDRIVASDAGQVLVLAGEPEKLRRLVDSVNQAECRKTGQAAVLPGPAHSRPELKGLSLEQSLLWDLRDLACRPLKAERHALDDNANLADFGFDSISLAEYAGLLSRHFGLALTPELFFSHSTLARIAAHLLERHRPALEACYRAEAKPAAAHVTASPAIAEPGRLENGAIAVIGVSGRFPGARSAEEMWRVLAEGVDMVGEIPPERYDWRDYYGDPRQDPGKTRCIWMGSVPGVDEFDPLFFEISPREAKSMDPRQRLLLQEAWNALEDAAIGPRHLAEQRVGMFVGVEEGDFQRLAGEESLTSGHNGILASRLAYFLDLTGPTMAINTACSSALVALHQAASSLRNGECEMAIAAGVNLVFSPDAFIGMTQAGMLSPDGKCFAFDVRANGMVPGEAVCCVVLKPLDRAESDGDRIYGVLRGSGVNYDGKTNGITAPSGASQQRLLTDVYRRAGIATESVEYIVTHGTGTQLGDPVEINALNDAFHGNRPGHCALTSTKTNFGHTFAASGLVSVISLLQAFRHETIPASLHCERENDYIQWRDSPFYVNKSNRPWPRARRERLGAVSAFGMSGTNAHAVLASYDREADSTPFQRPCYLLVLSAKTAEALRERVARLAATLESGAFKDGQLPSISLTLLEGRHPFRHRLALVASDLEEACYALRQHLAGERRPNLFPGEVDRGFTPQKTMLRYVEQLLDGGRAAAEGEARESLAALADFYRQGYDVDGRRLFAEAGSAASPPRLSLPGYPFARERHWPEPRPRIQMPAAKNGERLHPLLHRNESTLARLRFSSRFNGREAFLADHRIGGQLVFPGAAYLEMARAAAAQASELLAEQVELSHVAWLRPLVFPIGGGEEAELFCELERKGHDRLSFRIYSMDGAAERVHAQGAATLALAAAPQSPPDLQALASRCEPSVHSGEALYRDFEALDVHYGPTFRAAGHIRVGNGLAIGQLSAEARDPEQDGALLPPGLLDGALHVASSLGAKDRTGPALPFALESLRLYGDPAAAWRKGPLTVIAEYGEKAADEAMDKIGLRICDGAGACLAEMRGFCSRRLTGASTAVAKVEAAPRDEMLASLIRAPFWQPLDDAGEGFPADAQPTLLLLGLPAAVVERARLTFGDHVGELPGKSGDNGASAYRAAALALFQRLQGLRGGYLQLFVGQGQDDLRMMALDGMLQSAMLENGELKARLVALDPAMGDEALFRTMIEQSRLHRAEPVRVFSSGSLYGRRWRELAEGDAREAAQPFRDGGVYAITGGAGGLGMILAKHIADSCLAPVLCLSGRSERPSSEAARSIEALRARGAKVDYRSLDVADAAAAAAWIDGIHAEHGALHGLIHAAGVIRDGMIINKTADEFEQVLSAKVAGVEALDRAIGERPLDFLLCCSSQSAMGNLGQADYAAANAYMDAFMHHRQTLAADGKRKGRSLSINWPLWRDGGMRLPEVIEQQMRRRFGIAPMPTQVGVECLRRALSAVGAQAWAVYGEASRLPAIGMPGAASTVAAVPAPSDAETGGGIDDGELRRRIAGFITGIVADVSQIDAAKIHPEEKFETYGFDSIMAVGVTQALEEHLGPLPKTLLFEHVNIARMADHFAVKHRAAFAAMFGAAGARAASAAEAEEPRPAAQTADTETPEDEGLCNHIAVIGLGGYYPGADNIDRLWNNLAAGVDCMGEFPAERWDHGRIYYKNRSVLGKTTCINGSFIADVDKFDYGYFKMPKVYADHMSPEVRLFLQAAVHAFEDAGYSRETMQSRYGGDVGVLVGTMANDYHYYGFERNVFSGAMASGSGMATIPMTVSYFYGLTGPSLFIDTMCSSSSTCIHTACQMLKHDETQMVLAGGLNLMYHPYTTVNTSQGNFTSSTSTSVNSYGVGADGTVIGEGVGAVLLKRLDRAIADRDRIYGVIKGSAITNAGERNGFNVPNPELQTLAIRQALEQANVHPSTISYVEGHGSGTKLGDPIEVLGLTNAFSRDTDDKQFCHLGSIKSNIGHLLAASGIAGLTKVLLQFKHGQIAPSIHSGELNRDIDFADTPFVVPQRLIEWRRPERVVDGQLRIFPRRAGITSIAAGGMNAHMIVEECQEPADSGGAIADDKLVFVFSVHKLSLMEENLAAFRDWLSDSDAPLARVAHTLQAGRNNLRNRLAIRCHSRQALLAALAACIAGSYQAGEGCEIHYRFPECGGEHLPKAGEGEALTNMLARWLDGDNRVDWSALYTQKPLPVSLPAYRFEKTRCWYMEDGEEPSILDPRIFSARPHPLVEESVSTLEPEARFRAGFAEAGLLDYLYRDGDGRRFSVFNFADAALALPALAGHPSGEPWSVSCAFEHHVADWSSVSGLAYRMYEVEDGMLELEFELSRDSGERTSLGFALIRPRRDDEALAPPSDEVLQLRSASLPPAGEPERRLALAGCDFTPYLDGEVALRIGRSGLLLTGSQPAHLQNRRVSGLALPPHLATAIDKALRLSMDELGLPNGRVIVRNIDGLRSDGPPADDYSVLLSGAALAGDELSFALWVLDDQSRVSIQADRIRLYLGQKEREDIRRDHYWLSAEEDNLPLAILSGKRPQAVEKDRQAGAVESRADGAGRGERMLAFIRQELRDKLGFSEQETGESAQIQDLGLDSIMVVQLTDSVNKRFGTKLMPDLFYEKRRLGELAARLDAI